MAQCGGRWRCWPTTAPHTSPLRIRQPAARARAPRRAGRATRTAASSRIRHDPLAARPSSPTSTQPSQRDSLLSAGSPLRARLQVFEVKAAPDSAGGGPDHLVVATGNDGQYYKCAAPPRAHAPLPPPGLASLCVQWFRRPPPTADTDAASLPTPLQGRGFLPVETDAQAARRFTAAAAAARAGSDDGGRRQAVRGAGPAGAGGRPPVPDQRGPREAPARARPPPGGGAAAADGPRVGGGTGRGGRAVRADTVGRAGPPRPSGAAGRAGRPGGYCGMLCWYREADGARDLRARAREMEGGRGGWREIGRKMKGERRKERGRGRRRGEMGCVIGVPGAERRARLQRRRSLTARQATMGGAAAVMAMAAAMAAVTAAAAAGAGAGDGGGGRAPVRPAGAVGDEPAEALRDPRAGMRARASRAAAARAQGHTLRECAPCTTHTARLPVISHAPRTPHVAHGSLRPLRRYAAAPTRASPYTTRTAHRAPDTAREHASARAQTRIRECVGRRYSVRGSRQRAPWCRRRIPPPLSVQARRPRTSEVGPRAGDGGAAGAGAAHRRRPPRGAPPARPRTGPSLETSYPSSPPPRRIPRGSGRVRGGMDGRTAARRLRTGVGRGIKIRSARLGLGMRRRARAKGRGGGAPNRER